MSRRQLILFILALAVLLTGRLLMAGTGYLEDQDEFLFIWIHLHAAAFAHLSTWVDCLFRIQGQPPEVLVRLLEYITLLPVAAASGKQMLHPDILYFMGMYNILVSMFILYVFFRILLKLNFSVELAITGMFLLGTLLNFNMYTRHILPYDNALLFQMLALNLLLRDNVRPRTILMAGLLSAIGLTNYFGGFMFIFINGGYLIFSNYKRPTMALKNSLLFICPFIALALFYEAFAAIDGRSYYVFLKDYYQTVGTEGSFEEGLVYVFLYFYIVEKWWGVVLLCLFFAGNYLLFKRGSSDKAKNLILLGIIGYLTFGSYVFFFHKMVFEGRVFHTYYPFIVLGVVAWLEQQRLFKANMTMVAIVVFACINYCFVIKDFNAVGYPRNAIYKYHLFEEKGKTSFTYLEEIPTKIRYSDRAALCIDSVGPGTLPAGKYLLTNICFLPSYTDSLLQNYRPWHKAETDSVIFEQLHFESYPAYTMDYCTRSTRDFFISKQFKIRVIKRRVDT